MLSVKSEEDGHYRVAGVPFGEWTVLVVATGYVPRTALVTVVAGDSTTLDFKLARAMSQLVDGVGLLTGDHEAISLGASLSRVDAESISHVAPVATFSELLTGRVTGLEVRASSGTAGTSSQLTMRGVANPYLSIAPLVYVDGVRVDASLRALTIDVGGQSTSRLDDLEPATLQSVDILRGPAAAALYGAEATNGVILITTRQGFSGPVRFRAFTGQGFESEAVRFPDNVRAVTATGAACPLNEQEEGSCRAQMILRSNPLERGAASPIAAGAVRAYGLEATGSVDKVRFAVGGDLRSDPGIYHLPEVETRRLTATYGAGALRDDVIDPNYLRRVSVYSTATVTPSDRLEIGAAARYVTSALRLPINDNADAGLLVNGLLGAPDSTPSGQWWMFRPGEIFQVSSTQSIDRFNGSVNIRFRPTAFLNVRGILGGETLRQHDGQLERAGEGPRTDTVTSGFVTDNWARTKRLTAIGSVTATERLRARLSGRTSVGIEYWSVNGDTVLQDGAGLPRGRTNFLDAANRRVSNASGRVSDRGYLFEQEFSLANRLFVGGALRWDHAAGQGSSPSAVLDPAAWASWVVPLDSTGPLRLLRLRAATGSVARRSPFPLPGAPVGGALLPSQPQPDPERTAESEVGADAEFLSGRLGIAATAYGRRTRGFVTFIPTPPSSGFAYKVINGGEIWNEGVEVDVTSEPIRTEHATLGVKIGAWGNRGRVARLTAYLLPVGFQQRMFQGYPVGTYYVVSIVGFNDSNGDGVLTRNELTLGDVVASGSPLPTQGASASVSLNWRRWLRVSTAFEYQGGGSQQNITAASRCQVIVCSARSMPGTPLADQAQALADGLGLEGRPEDAGFVKLREISVSMIAPARWAARFGVSELRLTLAGRNLATWTLYRGLDPEVNAEGAATVARMDSFTQPLVRYWTARLDVEF